MFAALLFLISQTLSKIAMKGGGRISLLVLDDALLTIRTQKRQHIFCRSDVSSPGLASVCFRAIGERQSSYATSQRLRNKDMLPLLCAYLQKSIVKH